MLRYKKCIEKCNIIVRNVAFFNLTIFCPNHTAKSQKPWLARGIIFFRAGQEKPAWLPEQAKEENAIFVPWAKLRIIARRAFIL